MLSTDLPLVSGFWSPETALPCQIRDLEGQGGCLAASFVYSSDDTLEPASCFPHPWPLYSSLYTCVSFLSLDQNSQENQLMRRKGLSWLMVSEVSALWPRCFGACDKEHVGQSLTLF